MTTPQTIIHLTPQFFFEKEKALVEHGPLSASTLLFESGVCGLRLKNEVGQLVLLPFQGQQIWSAEFGGRNLTMKTIFDEPQPTRNYLDTYGGFLLHCGATAMGVPTAQDNHPLHGELPNAPYQKAYVVVGQDDKGTYIGMGGRYQHRVAFTHNYSAEPLVKLYAGSSRFWTSMTITNLKGSDMELMYMAHANFRPVDNGRLVYSAPADTDHIRVRTSIPSHVKPNPAYVAFLQDLARDPAKHNVLSPELPFDPEVVFFINYQADEQGWAHSMQVHPDGSADYIAHRPDQLDKGVRWICRTPDKDALGLNLPATAEPEGYTAEKAKGNVKTLPPKGTFYFELELGALSPAEAQRMEEKIARLVSG